MTQLGDLREPMFELRKCHVWKVERFRAWRVVRTAFNELEGSEGNVHPMTRIWSTILDRAAWEMGE